MEFKDKVVLITGASRGIGRATALAFAREGAKVILNYRSNHEMAQQTFEQLDGKGHMKFKADISKGEEVVQMITKTIEEYKYIDILVNNAGISLFHPIDDISFADWQHAWQQVIQTNLVAVANTCHQAAQHMIKRRYGRIVNVSSRGAYRGEPMQPAYGASKAGINALSQSLAKQLGKYNISVMAVAPGFVETDMAKDFLTAEERIAVENDSPMKRMAQPEEVANAILYLASDKSSFSTGAILDVNGASYFR